MTQTNTVIIYEFRSGFTYQYCGNSWRSTGFYGPPYIGNTFHDGFIPEPLQRAIRREDSRFDVCQKIDYQSFINLPHQRRDSIGFKEFNDDFVDRNALVGIIIEKWAVLAVVSVAIDFANKPFPVKRYFCCVESYDGNYDAMATLITFFFEKGPENLTFDILENKPQNSYKIYPLSSQYLQSLKSLNCDYSMFDGLRLINPDLEMSENNLLQMWKTCLSLVSGDRKKAAWAFNIDSVANLTDFTLIQAGTQEFFQRNYSRASRQPALPPTSSPQLALPPTSSDQRELSNSNYSFQPVYSAPQSDAESVFNDFVENGNLSLQNIVFVTTDIKQNYEQWKKLVTKSRDEIIEEFSSFSSLIRYYTLSALIVPERAIDLFQQLLFSEDDIWNIFLNSAEEFKSFQQEQNDSDLKKTIEEGVWYIINYIIQKQFKLPPKKKFRLYQPKKLQRFFAEKGNIWREAIFSSLEDEVSANLPLQYFYNNLHNKEYRKEYTQGYEKISKIISLPREEFLFIRALIEQKFKGKVSHGLYSKLEESCKNYPLFSDLEKEKTIWENLCSILNNIPPRKERQQRPRRLSRMNSQQTNRNPVDKVPNNTQNQTPPNNSGNRGQRNNPKRLLTKIVIIFAVCSALSAMATIILTLLKFRLEIVMTTFNLALLLTAIAFFVFIIQEFIP
jgi:hypothetical protein